MFRSDFLFARPSFIEGISRILDLGNTLNEYNQSPTPEEADMLALYCDVYMVSKDLRDAIEKIRKDIESK